MVTSNDWVQVGQVKQLYVYPVKSFMFNAVDEAEVTKVGLKAGEMRDRYFMVSDVDGKLVTARDYPKFVLIKAHVHDNVLSLSSSECPDTISVDLKSIIQNADMIPVTVWNQGPTKAYYCGDNISIWICKFVSAPFGTLKLLYYNIDDSRTVDMNKQYEQYAGNNIRNDKTPFHDFGPINLQTEASLQDLNAHFSDETFSIEYFRPSIYVSGDHRPFDEDNWAKVKIGNDVVMSYGFPCTRCIFTTIDPKTGIKHPNSEPLRTLRSYRQVPPDLKHIFKYSPVFGATFLVDQVGLVKIGDPVYVLYETKSRILVKKGQTDIFLMFFQYLFAAFNNFWRKLMGH